MTEARRILARIELRKWLEPYKRKVHALRAATLGDYSYVEESGTPQRDPYGHEPGSRAAVSLPDLLVRDFEPGISNDLIHHVRTLVLTASNQTPDISFEDVDPLERSLMQLYLAKCIRRCSAEAAMRRALTSYCVDGLGWAWTTLKGPYPTVQYADTLDVVWDPRQPQLESATWVALAVRRPLYAWVEEYGEEPFDDLLEEARGDSVRLDEEVEVFLYWDTEGDDGTFAALRADKIGHESDGRQPESVIEGPIANPHFTMGDGYRVPLLPLHASYFLLLPSTAYPVSPVEMMIPHATSKRDLERYMSLVIERGVPFYTLRGDMDKQAYEDFLRGDIGALVRLEAGDIEANPPMSVPPEVLALHQEQERRLTQQSGANPYASGGTVAGTRYAAEVNQISSASGLVSSTMAVDHAEHWQQVATGLLALGKYDQSPITLHIDGVDVRFGMGFPDGPIYDYIVEGAKPLVSRDDLQFMGRFDRIAFAERRFQAAIAAAGVAPNTVSRAYSDLLRAFGERDVAGHFESPAGGPVVGPGMQGLTADVQQEQEASTQ